MAKFVSVSQVISDVAQVRNISRRDSFKIVSKILEEENIETSSLVTRSFGKKVDSKIVTTESAKLIFGKAKTVDLSAFVTKKDTKTEKVAYLESKTDHLEIEGYKVVATYKDCTFSVNLGRSLEAIEEWVDRHLERIDAKTTTPEITIEGVKQLEQLLPDTLPEKVAESLPAESLPAESLPAESLPAETPDTSTLSAKTDLPELLEALEPETVDVFKELEAACDVKVFKGLDEAKKETVTLPNMCTEAEIKDVEAFFADFCGGAVQKD